MAKNTVRMNDDGMRALFGEIAANLDAADRKFRETHEGYPFEVVRKDAPAALAVIDLNDDAWDAYAAAVADGQPFTFELTG